MYRKRLISTLKFIFFLLVGLFLLWLVFRKVDLSKVLYQISHANYWWVLFSYIFAVMSHIARAVRWNILIKSMGYKTKTSTTFYAVMSGYLANMALPRIGELARCGVLNRKDKIPLNSLFGSVIAERVFDVIILGIMIFLVIIFQLDLVGKFVNEYVFTPIYDKFSDNLSLIFIIVFSVLMGIAFIVVLYRLFLSKIRQLGFYNKVHEFFKGLMDGFKTIQRLKRKEGFFFWTIMIWLMYLLMTYFVFFAMKDTASLTFVDAITILAIGSLGMVAPVPGGIGTYHLFVSLVLFELYGVPKASAASWATLMHASQGVLVFILGVFSYFMIFLHKKNDNEKSRSYSFQDIQPK